MNVDPSLAIETIRKIINGFFAILPKVFIAVIVFLTFFFIARGINAVIRTAIERNKKHQNLALVLGRLAQWVILLIGIFIALIIVIPSLTASDFVGLLGITSVATGFAFSDILQNFLAGILILLTEPFDIGDQIIVGDFEGTVENIETRATIIKTYDGRRVVIPNAQLFTQSVTVNTAYETRRLEAEFYIVAAADAEKAKRVSREAIAGVDGVLDDPAPDVLAVGFESAGVTLRARWWITPPRRQDAMEARDSVVTAIHRALTTNGIELYNPNA
jgi:small conductance mechanosensitive channel